MLPDAKQPAPREWNELLAGYDWQSVDQGRSTADVFRLSSPDRPSLFMKCERTGMFAEISTEAACLRWLRTTGIACPEVVAEMHEEERSCLLMTALPGGNLISNPFLSPEQIVDIAAEALRKLHALDTKQCPFDQRLEKRIAHARRRLEAGLVDESDFDDERLGRTAGDIFEELLTLLPRKEELVVTHGDASPENLLSHEGRFSGFVDCSRLGVADFHQDVALACRNIRDSFGDECSDRFVSRYGKEVDPRRVAFYQLLDEFF